MDETIAKKTTADQVAHIISEISNPLFIAFPTLLIIALTSAPNIGYGLLWWVITVAGISIAPLLFIRRGVRKGTYTDHHISKREQRFVPLLFGIGCMVLSFLWLNLLGVSSVLIATVLAVIIACGISLVVTRYWKISLHLVGMAGAVTVFVLLFGPIWWVLAPLVVLVGWARWQVRAHTVLQAVAGTLLAVGVTVIIFQLFGLLR